VFVYLLEGTLTMQVKGGAPVTLHPGDTYHESPTDIHTVSQNASKTEPAKYKVGIPLTLDASGSLFNSFHVRTVPTVIAIDGGGRIQHRIEGSDPGLAAELSQVALVR
jgi:hypothetical protein